MDLRRAGAVILVTMALLVLLYALTRSNEVPVEPIVVPAAPHLPVPFPPPSIIHLPPETVTKPYKPWMGARVMFL